MLSPRTESSLAGCHGRREVHPEGNLFETRELSRLEVVLEPALNPGTYPPGSAAEVHVAEAMGEAFAGVESVENGRVVAEFISGTRRSCLG
jgi:hypothetical protein